jgi:hypothetical protein
MDLASYIGLCVVLLVCFFVFRALVIGVANKAEANGRDREDWTMLAIFLTPLLAYVILLMMGPASIPASGSLKVCPYCAEKIQGAAIKCRFCGSELKA